MYLFQEKTLPSHFQSIELKFYSLEVDPKWSSIQNPKCTRSNNQYFGKITCNEHHEHNAFFWQMYVFQEKMLPSHFQFIELKSYKLEVDPQ